MAYKILVVLMAGLMLTQASAETTSSQEKLSVDERIEKLKEERDLYLDRAEARDIDAMRWQFENEFYLDAKRAYQLSEQDRQAAAEIQKRIDALEAQKKSKK